MASLKQIFEAIKTAKQSFISELQVTQTRDNVTKMQEIGSLRKANPTIAKAIVNNWGSQNFYTIIQMILDGDKFGGEMLPKLKPFTLQSLGVLTVLHSRKYNDGASADELVNTDKSSPEYQYNFAKGVQSR